MYSEYFGMVRHLVMQNSGSEEDAKDVFQESMVSLFEMVQRPDFTFTSQPSTLVYSRSMRRSVNTTPKQMCSLTKWRVP